MGVKDQFRYDPATDIYICPAGESLHPRREHKRRQMVDYVADPQTCEQCALPSKCTNSKLGRSVARHMRQAALDEALLHSRTDEAREDRRRRRYLMEGSFAQSANRHHFKKSRWCRLWRQQIQDLLIAAVQNALKMSGTIGKAATVNNPVEVMVGGGLGQRFIMALRALLFPFETLSLTLCRLFQRGAPTPSAFAF